MLHRCKMRMEAFIGQLRSFTYRVWPDSISERPQLPISMDVKSKNTSHRVQLHSFARRIHDMKVKLFGRLGINDRLTTEVGLGYNCRCTSLTKAFFCIDLENMSDHSRFKATTRAVAGISMESHETRTFQRFFIANLNALKFNPEIGVEVRLFLSQTCLTSRWCMQHWYYCYWQTCVEATARHAHEKQRPKILH